MAKSAKRRHHIERLKKNRKHYWGRHDGKFLPPLTPKQLNMVVRYPKLCGCYMCSSRKRKKQGVDTFKDFYFSVRLKEEMNSGEW